MNTYGHVFSVEIDANERILQCPVLEQIAPCIHCSLEIQIVQYRLGTEYLNLINLNSSLEGGMWYVSLISTTVQREEGLKQLVLHSMQNL